jgi:hypothetical protein
VARDQTGHGDLAVSAGHVEEEHEHADVDTLGCDVGASTGVDGDVRIAQDALDQVALDRIQATHETLESDGPVVARQRGHPLEEALVGKRRCGARRHEHRAAVERPDGAQGMPAGSTGGEFTRDRANGRRARRHGVGASTDAQDGEDQRPAHVVAVRDSPQRLCEILIQPLGRRQRVGQRTSAHSADDLRPGIAGPFAPGGPA